MKEVLEVLPKMMRELIEGCKEYNALEEIRVRIGRPLECIAHGKVFFHEYIVTPEDAMHLLNKLSQFSIYTIEEELKRGYVTLRGGHRIGLAGKVITEKSAVKMIRDVSSFNIRIARQKMGIAEPLLSYLYESRWLNTMVIGPPQTGKTTLLRDVARCMSQGVGFANIPSCKVGIVDERSEIAGCVKGIPQYEFGPRVDVLDACPKAEGMMMMIRSMSPDILIVDEIGRMEDSEAIMEAVHAGVQLFISAHGFSFDDIRKRPSLKAVMEFGVFERFIELSKAKGPGTVVQVKDREGKPIQRRKKVQNV
ncbi:stage III sporulation protein AA [Bacillus cytotoxicus]|uniref:Sporulation stage III protein AA n=2 Tax=Bacillus cytotoxicus TaxID=580165 RepID=A0AAX2CK19_9BACI|nr:MULTISPECIES: stage III sporulation protein AA [Bacillus cereus group]ABS23119.1 Sporulation stage III protein AA [Bacillus cytotoxicus NVH 391-98]AWC29770.1 stage III sporulation protein AA [Bacillus cytotoxicus]AWC33775.1 stage III sporulation protein AA [Bacillus cytotoxicus]AWC37755.1 stage III sporulation protein AA [Bacillus cytotoxicus]AWC41901.1 stage III sporulation protein AA [Bacillus cytotoxicus]